MPSAWTVGRHYGYGTCGQECLCCNAREGAFGFVDYNRPICPVCCVHFQQAPGLRRVARFVMVRWRVEVYRELSRGCKSRYDTCPSEVHKTLEAMVGRASFPPDGVGFVSMMASMAWASLRREFGLIEHASRGRAQRPRRAKNGPAT